ncbi:MAG TPA: hypothetical protein VMT31_00610 [Methanomicrobiales archaeon]|jgi:hypothetical protein|nr:hypothetical protein [Methanomicrobiales archaeon]
MRTATLRALAALVIVCAPFLAAAAMADPSDVTVSGIRISPAVLMRGDTATVTITAENQGGTSVAVRRAYLLGEPNYIRALNDPYPTVGDIGAGHTRDFSFLIRADGPDGTYYPTFVLDFRDANSLIVPFPVEVKSTELALSVLSRPDRFSRGRRDTVTILIGNPRTNDVTGVNLLMAGEGLDLTPASYFIGTLKPDATSTVSFNITPQEAGNLSITASYQNGANSHALTIFLPVALDDDLKRASLVASNLVVTREGGTWHLTGDVSNAGLEVANAVTVTAGGTAVPVDPFRSYVVGSLNPDDFASFEISFTAGNADSILLLLQFKDREGRVFSSQTEVLLTAASSPVQAAPSLPPLYLLGAVVIIVAGIILWSWKRKH